MAFSPFFRFRNAHRHAIFTAIAGDQARRGPEQRSTHMKNVGGRMATVAVLALSCSVVSARADGMAGGRDWYAGLFAGAAWPSDFDANSADSFSVDTGFAFGGVIGKQVADNVRAELEISNWRADADTDCVGKCGVTSLDVDTLSILGNVWVDIPVGAEVTPYVGGGLGMAGVSMDGADDDGASWNFAWQLGAGVRMAVAPATTLDLGYRYKSTTAEAEDFGFPFDNDVDAETHVLQVGVSFSF
jgi:opacity protein-like surface antigen